MPFFLKDRGTESKSSGIVQAKEGSSKNFVLFECSINSMYYKSMYYKSILESITLYQILLESLDGM